MRAAEEAAATLAGSIHPEQCIKVLCPIVQTADYPINLAAIKMQTKVIERIGKESLLQLLPDIIPGLLQVSHHAKKNTVTIKLNSSNIVCWKMMSYLMGWHSTLKKSQTLISHNSMTTEGLELPPSLRENQNHRILFTFIYSMSLKLIQCCGQISDFVEPQI